MAVLEKVKERVKTFLILMTENGDIQYIDNAENGKVQFVTSNDKEAQKEAEKIMTQYNEGLKEKEVEVQNEGAIRDEGKGFIPKEHVSEQKANEIVRENQEERIKDMTQKQIGD